MTYSPALVPPADYVLSCEAGSLPAGQYLLYLPTERSEGKIENTKQAKDKPTNGKKGEPPRPPLKRFHRQCSHIQDAIPLLESVPAIDAKARGYGLNPDYLT